LKKSNTISIEKETIIEQSSTDLIGGIIIWNKQQIFNKFSSIVKNRSLFSPMGGGVVVKRWIFVEKLPYLSLLKICSLIIG
jgi:hypothetical protein